MTSRSSNGERVQLTPGTWIGLVVATATIVGSVLVFSLRVESRLTAVETKVEMLREKQ